MTGLTRYCLYNLVIYIQLGVGLSFMFTKGVLADTYIWHE